ncbi:hypothetical protein [Nocardia wallacei]|uniref:hypothetical protein n=1 Tax=Nocardia wallacei TaxID=480035 RepID=UPI002457B9C0|nr:hypothetical protein [Nocardia wallacei]
MTAMTSTSGTENPGDQPTGTSAPDASEATPEWAPVEPLPSSEMFVAAFAGLDRVAARDILDPAADLADCHRECRLAFEVLSDPSASAEEMKSAAAELVSAKADLDMLIMVIDDAVAERLRQRHEDRHFDTPPTSPADAVAEVAVHTESIGEIAAKMADLWERAVSKGADPMTTATSEAHELAVLCAGYDCLAAEIESDRRTLPGM